MGKAVPLIPTRHMLRAALGVARALDRPSTRAEVARLTYDRIPTGGLFDGRDLEVGQGLLMASGLVELHDHHLLVNDNLRSLLSMPERDSHEILLAALVLRNRPQWTRTCVQGSMVVEELIPDGELDRLSAVVPDPDRREALLLAAGRRYDPGANRRVGELGEEGVVDECRRTLVHAGRPDLAARVLRVSGISDQLGYDVIAPTLHETPRRMEVKTAGRILGTVEIFITRTEALVGSRDPTWSLVVCTADQDGRAAVEGWCSYSVLAQRLPRDQNRLGSWETALIRLSHTEIFPGLPPHS